MNQESARLKNGSIDLLALTLEKSTRRKEFFDFTLPLYDVSTKLAVKKVDTSLSNFFDFFKVYGIQIWTLMGLAFLVFSIIGIAVRFTEYKLRLRSNLNLYELLWKFLRLQLIQNEGGMDFRLLAGSISLITFAFLQCSVIVSLFQGWILSSVVKTKLPQPFQLENLPWLLEHKHYSFVTSNVWNWYYEELNVSYVSPFYELRNAMINNPLIELPNHHAVFEAVKRGKKIMVLEEDEVFTSEIDQLCDLFYMESPFPTVPKHFMMQKGHRLLAEINRAIDAQRILILRAQRKYLKYRTHSTCTDKQKREKPLSLTPYYSVFVLFASGILLSLCAFSIEIIRKQSVNYKLKIIISLYIF